MSCDTRDTLATVAHLQGKVLSGSQRPVSRAGGYGFTSLTLRSVEGAVFSQQGSPFIAKKILEPSMLAT
jgi:hypothetical protein